jgi:hypothetical protein
MYVFDSTYDLGVADAVEVKCPGYEVDFQKTYG